MKQKDIGLLAVIAIISGVMSIFLSNIFFSSAEDRSQSVEVVQPLVSEFNRPPKEYFNKNSVNPTQTIEIGEDSNTKPFGNN